MANRGLKFLGNPCRRGHDGTRYVSDGKCVQCGALIGALKWATNREEQKKKWFAWYNQNRERHAMTFKVWREANAPADRLNSLEWKKLNPGRVRASMAKRKVAMLQRMPVWVDVEAIASIYTKAVATTKNIWNEWESEMVLKSVIKRACKRHFRDIVVNVEKRKPFIFWCIIFFFRLNEF